MGEEKKISDFLTQLKSTVNLTNPNKKIELARKYNEITDTDKKDRLDELIEKEPEQDKINLKNKLKIVIRIAQPPAPPPAQPKRPSGAAPPSVEETGAPSPSIAASNRPSGASAPSVKATGAPPAPDPAQPKRPSGAAPPSVEASRPSGATAPPVAASKPSGAAAPSIAAKKENRMEITQKINFNNYTDFENFFLTEKINIVNIVATAALKIENSEELGKSIFLDLKTITNKLDLKIINNKEKLFIKGLKYNNKFGSLLLYSKTTTATIFRNGKMTIETKLEDEKVIREEAKKFADIIYRNSVFKNKKDDIVKEEKLRFKDFKVVNVVGAADVMFNVDLKKMSNSDRNKQYLTYEPEKFSGLIFNCYKPKVTIIIFRTGKIILMGAKTIIDVKTAFKNILPILCLNR